MVRRASVPDMGEIETTINMSSRKQKIANASIESTIELYKLRRRSTAESLEAG